MGWIETMSRRLGNGDSFLTSGDVKLDAPVEPLGAKQPAIKAAFSAGVSPRSLPATMHGIIACGHVNGTATAKRGEAIRRP